jgi:hypothetical protein
MRIVLSGFIAGALAVVIFHQGSVFLLHHIGNDIPAVVAVFGKAAAPFNMAPTNPLGVPAIASQCFWGGVWGVVLAFILSRRIFPALAFGAFFGTLALTVAALTGAESPIRVLVKGGDTLSVDFLRSGNGFSHVILTGPADFVFEGEISV